MTSATGGFAWETTSLQQGHFVALVFLLSIPRAGQVEPPRTEDGLKIEESFLDHLAELLTIRLEPRFITSTGLCRTADGHIEVVVARNNRFTEPNEDSFLKEAEGWMQSDESPEKGTILFPARAAKFNNCIRRCLL